MIFFKHPVYPYRLKEDLIVRIELNSAGKVILCTGDTSATYKLSGEMYVKTSIPYTKVESIHYQKLSKKDTIWKIDRNNLSVSSLQSLLLLFLDKRVELADKNEEFYNSSNKKILVMINGDTHQLFKAGLQARNIYPELKIFFYKEHSNVTWK